MSCNYKLMKTIFCRTYGYCSHEDCLANQMFFLHSAKFLRNLIKSGFLNVSMPLFVILNKIKFYNQKKRPTKIFRKNLSPQGLMNIIPTPSRKKILEQEDHCGDCSIHYLKRSDPFLQKRKTKAMKLDRF